MNYDYEYPPFSRAVLAGVFVGLIGSVATLVFNYFYRSATGFSVSDVINVSSLIFIPIIILELCALLYYFLEKTLKRTGVAVYIILFAVVSVLCIYSSLTAHLSPDTELASQYKWLLGGVVIIMGVTATFLIPYFIQNDKSFI